MCGYEYAGRCENCNDICNCIPDEKRCNPNLYLSWWSRCQKCSCRIYGVGVGSDGCHKNCNEEPKQVPAAAGFFVRCIECGARRDDPKKRKQIQRQRQRQMQYAQLMILLAFYDAFPNHPYADIIIDQIPTICTMSDEKNNTLSRPMLSYFAQAKNPRSTQHYCCKICDNKVPHHNINGRQDYEIVICRKCVPDDCQLRRMNVGKHLKL